jgi:hypothetical protein
MTQVILNLYYDMKEKGQGWWYYRQEAISHFKYKANAWWEKFVRPTVPVTFKEIGNIPRSFICLLEITNPDGYCEIHSLFDTETDTITKKTWLPLLKREFKYIDLKDPNAVNSSYHILYATPFAYFETKEKYAQVMCDNLNACVRHAHEERDSWFSPSFAPAGLKRGFLRDPEILDNPDAALARSILRVEPDTALRINTTTHHPV